MPRPLIIGNGCFLVAYDHRGTMRDFYFPWVGQYNHLAGHPIRLGVYVDGQFDWLESESWHVELSYPEDAMIPKQVLTNDRLQVQIEIRDAMHPEKRILSRIATVTNLADAEREIRLYTSHDFRLAETDIGDTALYDPEIDGVIHFKNQFYVSIGGVGIFNWSCGVKAFKEHEGTFRDAEDGELSGKPIEQGSVDSTLEYRFSVGAHSSVSWSSWMVAGSTRREIIQLAKEAKQCENIHALARSSWVNRQPTLPDLSDRARQLFLRSLQIVEAHIDRNGAILAAIDSDIFETNRASYCYLWPRDGALVAVALDRLGRTDLTRPFFAFCSDVSRGDSPLLLHKYSPDRTVGATWHPWIMDGKAVRPIQEDETALTVYALAQHLGTHGHSQELDDIWNDWAMPACDAMLDFRWMGGSLTQPSYDLWEERFGVHLYTTATKIAALRAAAAVSKNPAYEYAANDLSRGLKEHFWSETDKRFARCLTVSGDSVSHDMTPDSATFALGLYEVLPIDDPMLLRHMESTQSACEISGPAKGFARYVGDYYFRRSEQYPGNPWIICTLWWAQWVIRRAKTRDDLQEARMWIEWACDRAGTTGVLSEQYHPETCAPLSVSPLAWSHAEFMRTVLDFESAWRNLN